MKTRIRYLKVIILIITVFILLASNVYAEPETLSLPKLGFTVESSDNPQDVSTSVRFYCFYCAGIGSVNTYHDDKFY